MCVVAALGALGVAAETAATISTVMQVAGSAFSFIRQMQQTEAQNKQADYNAAVARNNAKLAEYQAEDAQVRGEQEAVANQRRTLALRGNQRATMAARGLDLTAGTPQSLIDQTDYFSQVDEGTIRLNADKESYTKRVQGQNATTEAQAFESSKRSPLLAGATSLLSSASAVDSKWNSYSSSPTTSTTSWAGSSGVGLKAPANALMPKGW